MPSLCQMTMIKLCLELYTSKITFQDKHDEAISEKQEKERAYHQQMLPKETSKGSTLGQVTKEKYEMEEEILSENIVNIGKFHKH